MEFEEATPQKIADIVNKNHQRFMDEEEARGELAGSPDSLPCYDCTRLVLPEGMPLPHDSECVQVRVVKLGPVVNPADPTQSYILECGHTTI